MTDTYRTRRLWQSAFMLPALAPLLLNVILGQLTGDPDFRKALGPAGQMLLAKIGTALSLTSVAMVLMGMLCILMYAPRAEAKA